MSLLTSVVSKVGRHSSWNECLEMVSTSRPELLLITLICYMIRT